MKMAYDKERLLADMGRICAEALFLTYDEGAEAMGKNLSRDDRSDLQFVSILLQHAEKLMRRVGTSRTRQGQTDLCDVALPTQGSAILPSIPQFE